MVIWSGSNWNGFAFAIITWFFVWKNSSQTYESFFHDSNSMWWKWSFPLKAGTSAEKGRVSSCDHCLLCELPRFCCSCCVFFCHLIELTYRECMQWAMGVRGRVSETCNSIKILYTAKSKRQFQMANSRKSYTAQHSYKKTRLNGKNVSVCASFVSFGY